MKIGISTFVTDASVRPEVLGRAVEQRGFESLFLPEHSHIPVSRETPFPFGSGVLPAAYYRSLDPFVVLAAIAVTTSTLRIGTGVTLLAQRDVIYAAKEIASVDVLSNGRIVVGVGVGWNREEMRDHGANPATRGAKLDEQLAALKEIWTNEQAEFHGEYIDFEPFFQWPKPVQRPHPALYIGGNSLAAVDRAVRFGAGWMPIAVNDASDVATQVDWMSSAGGPDAPITVLMARRDPELLAAYKEVGVERVTLFLPVKKEGDALRRLDALAEVAEQAGVLVR